MSHYKAFIDNGQIKITDFTGLDYEAEISNQAYAEKVFFQNFAISCFIIWLTISLAISPLFFEFFSNVQVFIFVVLAIVGLMLLIFSLKKLNHARKTQTNLTQELNLAKAFLQDEILSLKEKLT